MAAHMCQAARPVGCSRCTLCTDYQGRRARCIFTLVSGQYAMLLTSVSAFGGWSFALGVQHV
eukprot:1257679-Prymnesium_polylepis.1